MAAAGLLTATMRRIPSRGLVPAVPTLVGARRGLGDSVRGPPVTDLAANLKIAQDFFTKGAISYVEYKQQCVSLRLFVFGGVSLGCVMALIWDPPKSSYWATYGPGGWFHYLKRCFSNDSPPLFVTKPLPTIDCEAIVNPAAAKAAPSAATQELAALKAPPKEPPLTISSRVSTKSKSAAPAPAKEAAPAPAAAAPSATAPKNSAFVFVKPHAVTERTVDMVREGLKFHGLKITSEGILTSEVIDEKKLIDQHYYAIASKATILKPKELNVPKDKFKSSFGLEWEDALKNGIVFNALDACKEFACSAEELSKAWNASKKAGNLVKFGGGFYCGLVDMNGKQLYVFNAFFMTMRSAFTAPGKQIHYYTVEWDETSLSWEDFRGKVLGPTDPKDAPVGSLRRYILDQWQALGLKSEPNVGDNGLHASASPFEAAAERMNWLEKRCEQDDYCKALVAAGVKETTVQAWSVDPQVNGLDGKKGSLFDMLEDLDATPCLEKAKRIQAVQ